MEVRRYLNVIRRRLLLILAIVAAGVVAGYLVTPSEDTYTATSQLYVGSRSIDVDSQSGDLSASNVFGVDRLITTFNAMIRSDPVASGAVDRSGVDRTTEDVRTSTAAAQVAGTNLIAVSVTDEDPAVARSLADAVSDEFVSLARDFEPAPEEAVGQVQEIVSVYEVAELPEDPNPTPLIRNMILGAIFGLVVAGAAVALLEHLDITLRSVDDVERRLELPVLGVVPALGNELPVLRAASVRRLVARREKA